MSKTTRARKLIGKTVWLRDGIYMHVDSVDVVPRSTVWTYRGNNEKVLTLQGVYVDKTHKPLGRATIPVNSRVRYKEV